MSYRAFVFDCDGTVLDTLPDLVSLANAVVADQGFPEHTSDEVKSYLGHGAEHLVRAALPENVTKEQFERALQQWYDLYPAYGFQKTAPFAGIVDTLKQLRERGAKLAVLSNKFDAATQEVIDRYLPGLFDVVHGESATIPKKPDPTGLLVSIEEMGVTPATTLYIGDSSVDMEVARRAGCDSAAVAWGYNDVEKLQQDGARYVLQIPANLLPLYEA